MIKANNIHKVFQDGEKLAVLQGLDLTVAPKRKIGVVGASGVGKSTLLHILGGLDPPTTGEVFVGQENLYALTEEKRSQLRNRFFGFIFQFYHLLPELTALENVCLPAWIAGLSKSKGEAMARQALESVGLANKTAEGVSYFSGGEQQRVALARALVLKPKMILADEPTGNLDHNTGEEVMEYLLKVVDEEEGSLILVTHNKELAKNLDEVFELKNGKLHKI